jgi:hypothetical protein
VAEGTESLLSDQGPFPRGASGRFTMRPVSLVQSPAILGFPRETFAAVGACSAGCKRASDLAVPAQRIPSRSCRRHPGASRQLLRVLVGGAMQRR